MVQIKQLLAPPVFANHEDKTLIARLLNIILNGLSVAMLVIFISGLFGNLPLMTYVVVFSNVLLPQALRGVMRYGKVRLVALLLAVEISVSVTLSLYFLGTVRAPGSLFYLLSLIVAGLALNRHVTLTMVGLNSFSVLGLILAEQSGWLSPPDLTVGLTQWVTFTATFTLIAIYVNLAMRDITEALALAHQELTRRQHIEAALRAGEEELRQHRDRLELLVAERTAELQQSRAQLWAFLDNAPAAALIRNTEGKYILANRRAAEWSGYSLERLIGHTPVELFPPEVRGPAMPVSPDTQPSERDFTIIRPDKTRHMHTYRFPIRDEQGVFYGIGLFVLDVTEQKETLEALERQSNLLHTILNSLGEGVIVADENGRQIMLNPMAERILGRGGTNLPPESRPEFYGIFEPDRQTPARGEDLPLVRAVQGHSTNEVELFIRNPDQPEGVDIAASGRPLLDEAGQVRGGVVIFRDHTRRKQAEVEIRAALAKTDALYRLSRSLNALDSLPDVLQTVTDRIAEALPADRVSLILFDLEKQQVTHFAKGGVGVDKMITTPFTELWQGLSGWVLRESRPALSPKGLPDPRETPDVQQRRIDTHCGAILVVPVQYQDRLLGTLTAVNRPDQPDFTEADVDLMVTMANQTAVAIQNAQTETQRTQLLQDVVAANRELNDFAYVVSHDLKAPLRAIGSLASWLAADYADKLGTEGQQQLDLLMGRVKRMNALIDGTLHYSRVGRLREEKKAVPFTEIIADVIVMLAPPPSIHIQIETQLPVVTGEPTRLQQVWQNLIGNALKFMNKPQGEIKIGCLDREDEWQFYVADNGPGIEARHFAKIFQLFQTLTPRDRQENTGVGLTIVQKIVELHGGKIWLESQVGVGSTFWFTLPK